MCTSFSNTLNFILSKRRIKIRRVPFYKYGFKSVDYYVFPGAAYGVFMIFQNEKPRFLFKCFDENGSMTRITRYCKENDLDYEDFLIKLLKSKGYQNLSKQPVSDWLSIRKDELSQVEDIEILLIQEDQNN